jgi:excisionase family DNA binding protein
MSGKRINPRLAKLHRSYSAEEAARTLGVHKGTVRNWIKAGLPTVDKTRPVLILGSQLRDWLEQRRKAGKRPCPPGKLYCFKCREPRSPALGMAPTKCL